jgi:2-iminobutanoate/2-iminopropanoate deaminase
LFLTDMDVFAACNEVWNEAFEPPRPTRSAIAVHQLPLGALAEVELWAYAPLD